VPAVTADSFLNEMVVNPAADTRRESAEIKKQGRVFRALDRGLALCDNNPFPPRQSKEVRGRGEPAQWLTWGKTVHRGKRL
jgi:hypothetical protein